MSRIDEKLTRELATLARLELSEEETRLYTQQIEKVLGYVQLLQEVDVTARDGRPIEPLTHPVELSAPYREDEARVSPARVIDCGPEVEQGAFRVPQVVG